MNKYSILTVTVLLIFFSLLSGCLQNEYTLTINIVGNGTVIKYLNQSTYHYGDVVQLTAIGYPGWTFDHWNGDITGSTNPTTITIKGNKLVTANFTQKNTNNKNISNEIKLVNDEIKRYGNLTYEFLEVTGAIRKIGDTSIDHAIVGVYFYNKQNNIIFYRTYSIYSFVKGYDYDFFVQFRSTDPYYYDYDHYSIDLDYV